MPRYGAEPQQETRERVCAAAELSATRRRGRPALRSRLARERVLQRDRRRRPKQNRHESATRESNPILCAKASQKCAGGPFGASWSTKQSRPRSGRGPATALSGNKPRANRGDGDSLRARTVWQVRAPPGRRFERTRLRKWLAPSAGAVPRVRPAVESENKPRANRGRGDSVCRLSRHGRASLRREASPIACLGDRCFVSSAGAKSNEARPGACHRVLAANLGNDCK